MGTENLQKREVVSRAAALVAEKVERIHITQDWVMVKLKQVVDRCMTAEPVLIREGGEWKESGVYKFDSKGAVMALALLGKHMGMFSDKIPQLPQTPGKETTDIIFEAEKKAERLSH